MSTRQLAVKRTSEPQPPAAPKHYTADGGALSHDWGTANRIIMQMARLAKENLETQDLSDTDMPMLLSVLCRASVMLGAESRSAADVLYAATLLLQRASPVAVQALCHTIGCQTPPQAVKVSDSTLTSAQGHIRSCRRTR